VAVFVPGFGLRALATKAASLAVAAAIFVTVAWPVISYVRNQGGCQWHVVLLGLEYNFNDDLGVTPSYYQWITRYTDEYLLTSVNSFRVRTEDAEPVRFCAAGYDTASAKYLAAIATTFPADMLTRAYASILRVSDLPFYYWGVAPQAVRGRIGRVLVDVVGTARVAVAILVVALGALSWRFGLFAGFVVAYVASYPMLQFAQRHFFHLEFLGWWGMAFVFALTVQVLLWVTTRGPRPWREPLPLMLRRGAACAAVMLVVALAPLPIARAYHDRSVSGVTDALMSAPRVVAAVSPGPSASELRVDVGDLGADPTQTAYLDVEIDLEACPEGVRIRSRTSRLWCSRSREGRSFSAT
jgi:hypothetical protein